MNAATNHGGACDALTNRAKPLSTGVGPVESVELDVAESCCFCGGDMVIAADEFDSSWTGSYAHPGCEDE